MSEYIVEPNPYPTFKKNGFNIRCDDWLIQREEIVRCRDCKQYCPDLYNNIGCEWFMTNVEPNGFCAWGERNDEQQ